MKVRRLTILLFEFSCFEIKNSFSKKEKKNSKKRIIKNDNNNNESFQNKREIHLRNERMRMGKGKRIFYLAKSEEEINGKQQVEWIKSHYEKKKNLRAENNRKNKGKEERRRKKKKCIL